MATFLTGSLDALQDQDPPPTGRLRRKREKLRQGGHGLCHHLLDGHLLPFLNGELRRWPWPTPSSSREEEVGPSSPEKERSMTMAIFLSSLVESCGGGHGIF